MGQVVRIGGNIQSIHADECWGTGKHSQNTISELTRPKKKKGTFIIFLGEAKMHRSLKDNHERKTGENRLRPTEDGLGGKEGTPATPHRDKEI